MPGTPAALEGGGFSLTLPQQATHDEVYRSFRRPRSEASRARCNGVYRFQMAPLWQRNLWQGQLRRRRVMLRFQERQLVEHLTQLREEIDALDETGIDEPDPNEADPYALFGTFESPEEPARPRRDRHRPSSKEADAGDDSQERSAPRRRPEGRSTRPR